MQKQKIGIVGGSIAGCASAILLDRLGFDVEIFERRKPEVMSDRQGAGIALPLELIQALKEEELLDQKFPAFPLHDRLFFTYEQQQEHHLAAIPISGAAVHWGVLYQQLAKRLPEAKVRYETKIDSIKQANGKVYLNIKGEEQRAFDFVLFADGYRSVGREYLFPEAKLHFTDYTCWQGNYMTTDPKEIEKMKHHTFYYLYDRGVLLAYQIPTANSQTGKAEATVTWFLYEKVDSYHPLVRDDKVHVNIYQDDMTDEYRRYLSQLASTHLPEFGRKMVLETPDPFTHAIYDTMVPEYVMENIALMGDAGILLRPHLGSGATKALQDALSLYHYCHEYHDMGLALQKWGKERQQAAAHLFGLSRAFGDFLVTESPKWESLDEKRFVQRWDEICDGYHWYQQRK